MAENYVLLETIQLTQSAATVIFNNIPQTGYTDLVIKISSRTSRATTQDGIYMVLNGVNSSGFINNEANGSSASSVGTASYGANWVAYAPSVDTTSNTFGVAEIYITNYSNTSLFKTISAESSFENNATSSNMALTSALWSQTAAVNEISFGCNAPFIAGSTFSLYGIAQIGTTPVIAPFATGGNIVANDGTYWYHAFLSSGTFTPLKELSCNVLVVGGGGGGGCFGGGGGAGELDLFSTQSLTAINYAVTVGAGGAGSTDYNLSASSGNTSSFASLVTSLGGGGGGRDTANGLAGGSGGGGGKGAFGGSASGSNTNAGGNAGGNDTNVMASGGGGGATAAGTAGTSSSNTSATGGNGGQGYALSSISGLTSAIPSAFGTMTHISSGGGGSAFKTDSIGGSAPVGGTGGTGAGNGGYARQSNSPLVAPTASTSYGSGGGGSASSAGGTALGAGTNGFKGIVIVRYAMV